MNEPHSDMVKIGYILKKGTDGLLSDFAKLSHIHHHIDTGRKKTPECDNFVRGSLETTFFSLGQRA